MTIGQRIREIRGKKSREEFAREFGIHPQSLYRYESGNRAIDTDLMRAICEKYSISSEWIMTGEGAREASPHESANREMEYKARIAELEALVREQKETINALTIAVKALHKEDKLEEPTDIPQYDISEPHPLPPRSPRRISDKTKQGDQK